MPEKDNQEQQAQKSSEKLEGTPDLKPDENVTPPKYDVVNHSRHGGDVTEIETEIEKE